LGNIKIGIFGEKGFQIRNFFTELRSVRLSERAQLFWTQFAWASCKWSSKRTWLVVLDIVRLSELQAKGDQKLLGPGRSSEPDFA